MEQHPAPSDDNAQNNPQDDPLPPTADSGEVSGESETDSKQDHAVEQSVNTSMESTRGDGEADGSAPAASSDNQRPVGQSTASEPERRARMIEQMTARRDREPRQRSIPRFRGGGSSPRSPIARSKDFIRRLFDRKKTKPLGTPYSSLPAKTPPYRSDGSLSSNGKVPSQGSPSLLDDRTSPCQHAGQSEVYRRNKARAHRGAASGNRAMVGGSPRVKSSKDAASAPEKTQADESTQDPKSGIPLGDGNREYTGEQTENQQHAQHSHAMTAAPPTLGIPKITGAIDNKDAQRNHEQTPRVQQDFIKMSNQISRHASLPEIPRQMDQSAAHGNTSSARPQLTLDTQLKTKRDGELKSSIQTSRTASWSGISWSSSTTLCSAAPSRSSSKEADPDDFSNYSESNQISPSSIQQCEDQSLQQITNDTRTAAAIAPCLAPATEADKPGTAATRRVDRCSGLLENICRSGDGTVETCLNSSNTPPPSPPPPPLLLLRGGASSNIVVGVNTATNPTPATASATQAPDATNAKDATFVAALMRGGGRRPRLDLGSFAPSEPLPAPWTSCRHSASSSPSAPILGPINATFASQTSSFGSPIFVSGCGGGHGSPVSVSPAPCEDTGKSSVVGENDEDDGDGSNPDVEDVCPDVALAPSCGSLPGTVAAAVAVEVTSFPSSLLRRVDVVRPAVHAGFFAPLPATGAADRDVDVEMHVPSRTSSLSPGSPLPPAIKYPVEEAAEPAPPAATDKENETEKQVNVSTLSQPSPPRLSLDQPIRSPKRQAKPWWETGSGSADNEVATDSGGQAREPGKEEDGSDGPAFCGGAGRDVGHGDTAMGSTDVGKVGLEMPARRRKRDGRRERADRCSTGSWISME